MSSRATHRTLYAGLCILTLGVIGGLTTISQAQTEGKDAPAKELTNSLGMKLRHIQPGTFEMGLSEGEIGRGDDARHTVEISKGFWIGTHEVTQEEYSRVTGRNPSSFSPSGDNKHRVQDMDTKMFPVENISWDDAVLYCVKLSALPKEKEAGRSYRLPTEAEWEFAARGGAKVNTPYTSGKSLSSKQANFNGLFPHGGAETGPNLQRTAKVGSYEANGYGLYDVTGNVWEWCSDRYGRNYYGTSPRKDPEGPAEGEKRVLRGGSWLNRTRDCRLSDRLAVEPDERYNNVGLRVVCEVKK